MKSFLLLVLWLLTTPMTAGGESEVDVCATEWVQFTCEYPNKRTTYSTVDVAPPSEPTKRSSMRNRWEHDGRFSLYHDTSNKRLLVVIRRLERNDFGDYSCWFHSNSRKKRTEVELKHVKSGCRTPLVETVDRAVDATLTCGLPSQNKRPRFLCRDTGLICQDIVTTSHTSNGTFSVRGGHFTVSISKVSSQDAGVYWCGVQSATGRYRKPLRQIQLEVKEPPMTSTLPTSSSTSSSSIVTSPVSTASSVPGVSWLPVLIAAAVAASLVLLLVVLVIIYKQSEHLKQRNHGDDTQEVVYEEIQERPLQSDSRPALHTVYVTATFPTTPSANMYSTVMDVVRSPAHPTVSQDQVYFSVHGPQQL